jgi:cytochrome c
MSEAGSLCVRFSTVALTLIVSPFLSLKADELLPAADVEAGERIYARCIGCHSPERNRTGPLHCGLFGRVSGSVKGYDYSEAMRSAAITWNGESLDLFLEAPLAAVSGTTLGFAGIKDRRERQNLTAWLATLSASSVSCNGISGY